MLFSYNSSELFMQAAEREAANESTGRGQKAKTKVYYKLRKELRNAPQTLASQGLSLIPISGLGSLLDFGLEKAIQDAKESRARKKQAAANAAVTNDPNDLEALRKVAKQEAKALVDLATTLEANQVKLKDASYQATQEVDKVLFWSDPYLAPTEDLCWQAASNIFERKRRVEKMQDMVSVIEGYLGAVKQYLSKSEEACETQRKALLSRLKELEAAGVTTTAPTANLRDSNGTIRLLESSF